MNGWRGSAEHKEWALQYRHSATLIALTQDRDGGRVVIDGNGDPRVEYTLSKFDMETVLAGIISGAEIMLAAGAKAIMTGQPNLAPYIAKPHHKGLGDPDWLAWIAGVEKAGIRACAALSVRTDAVRRGHGLVDRLGAPDGLEPDGHQAEQLGRRPARPRLGHAEPLHRRRVRPAHFQRRRASIAMRRDPIADGVRRTR